MTEEQSKMVKIVYNRFIENEEGGWTKIDDVLEILAYLSTEDLVNEARIKLEKHSKGLRCTKNHDHTQCFAPYVLESIEIILELYDLTKSLRPSNAYIITYYLAMSDLGLIFSS